MLNERLEKLSRIGSPKGISFVVGWLSKNVTSIDTLKAYTVANYTVKSSEIEPILLLLESMDLLKVINGGLIECTDKLKEKYSHGEESFSQWFIEAFIDFALNNKIIKIDTISYSIDDNAYIMSSTTIKPGVHACYRNILTDYDAITLLPDARYLVHESLENAIKQPTRHKKISEAQLLHNLQLQQEQGERGELYVLSYEQRRITDLHKQNKIQRISIIDVAAGFDIISFNSNASSKIDRFIEVKTYKGNEHFHWSKNEIEKARLMGDAYYLYLVDDDCIDKEDYSPTIIQNPFNNIFSSGDWMGNPESYFIQRVSRCSVNAETSVAVDQAHAASYPAPNRTEADRSELNHASTQSDKDLINELVSIANTLDPHGIGCVETVLSRLNDNHDGAYREQLDKVRQIAGQRNMGVHRTTIYESGSHVNHVENLYNSGTVTDNSVTRIEQPHLKLME